MSLEKWNPAMKAATVLTAVIMLSFQYNIYLNIGVFTICILLLLFFSKARVKQLLLLLVPALLAAFGMFMMGL